jgi:putative membrane protein
VARLGSFAVLWHPELMVATVMLAVAYLEVVGPLRSRFAGAQPVPWSDRAAFLGALLAVYAAQGSPLELLGNVYLFSAHMLQLVLLVFVAPPLLLRGLPPWLLRPVARHLPVLRWLTHPVRALALFIVVFSVYLIPPLTEAALGSGPLYFLEHLITLVLALGMWWPLLSRVPEAPPLPEPAQLLYAFLIELGMTAAFALVTFAGVPLYPTFAHAPRVLPIPPLMDQQAGGIIMRLGSLFSFGALLASRFFGWAARERAEDLRELAAMAVAPPREAGPPGGRGT